VLAPLVQDKDIQSGHVMPRHKRGDTTPNRFTRQWVAFSALLQKDHKKACEQAHCKRNRTTPAPDQDRSHYGSLRLDRRKLRISEKESAPVVWPLSRTVTLAGS
jgi:hypothetical protein